MERSVALRRVLSLGPLLSGKLRRNAGGRGSCRAARGGAADLNGSAGASPSHSDANRNFPKALGGVVVSTQPPNPSGSTTAVATATSQEGILPECKR